MNAEEPNENPLPPEDQLAEMNGDGERPSRRRAARWIGLLLIILSVLLAWYLLVVYLGWQNGQELLQEKRANTLTEQMAAQVELAREDLDAEKYRLAQRRLEWVLERDPGQEEAQALLDEIQARQNAQQATPLPQTTPTSTPVPVPTPTPGLISSPESELNRIQQLVNNQSWDQAISALTSFQLQFPAYQRQETDRLMYEAYLARGLEMISSDQVELGMAYLDQAEKLGDLPQEAQDYRLWAELYLAGIAYYGVNWEIAALNFRELCLAAPFYQSSCDRLIESLVNLGDQYAFAQEWCPAESYYREASQWGAAVNDQIGQAQAGCAQATPTPGAITDTLPITGTEPLSNTESAP